MSIKTMNSTPAADGFTMPAEWAHQQAVWMIWPFRPDNWREAGRFAQATFAKVADAIGGAPCRRAQQRGAAHLDALPHARYCIDCKQREEDGKRPG